MEYINGVSADPAEAWDAKAPEYDAKDRPGTINRFIQASALKVLLSAFRAGETVLEIGCGTGEDALALGRSGISVHGIDISPRMVAIARGKAAQANGTPVDFQVLAAERLDTLAPMTYDGAYSLMGPLNCVGDPWLLATRLARLIRPGGFLVSSVLNRCCVWEIAWHCLTGKYSTAFRRLGRRPVNALLAQGQSPVAVRYYTPRRFYAFFKGHFTLKKVIGLPVFLPPQYMRRPLGMLKPAFPFMMNIERFLSGSFPCNRLGDHFLAVMRRRT